MEDIFHTMEMYVTTLTGDEISYNSQIAIAGSRKFFPELYQTLVLASLHRPKTRENKGKR
jgi:hypothetical protein